MSDRPLPQSNDLHNSNDDEDPNTIIQRLCEMGFSKERVRQVVLENSPGGNKFESALEKLLTSPTTAHTPQDTDSMSMTVQGGANNHAVGRQHSQHGVMMRPNPTMADISLTKPASKETIVECATSQYDMGVGKSACSCIALVSAFKFLNAIHPNHGAENTASHRSSSAIVNANFLQDCILEGCQLYQTCIEERNRRRTRIEAHYENEHFSPEEILLELNQDGEIGTKLQPFTRRDGTNMVVRQGVLSFCADKQQLGLHNQLVACLNDNLHRQTEWTPVVMTKPPETILLLLPPQEQQGGGVAAEAQRISAEQHVIKEDCYYHHQKQEPYILIDSHPRHLTQFHVSGSYALFVYTLEELEQKISSIFPPVELGDDAFIHETMAMMYNSFDLYPLQLKSKS